MSAAPLVAAIKGVHPRIDETAFLAPTSVILGRVRLGARASVWYGAVLRGDDDEIVVGEDSNIQDVSVLHADPGRPAVVGDRVTVGHGAVVHGAHVSDDVLVGMRAVILNDVRVGSESLVAAGAVLRPGMIVPPGSLVAGVPAVVRRRVTDAELELIDRSWRDYVRNHDVHRSIRPCVDRAGDSSGSTGLAEPI